MALSDLMDLSDTIVAVSSPAGAGERAILRLSGPRAVEISDQVFTPDDSSVAWPRGGGAGTPPRNQRPAGDMLRGGRSCPPRTRAARTATALADGPTYTAHPGQLAPPGAGLSVPATAYLMRAPRSYTREDVVEFHVGGWPAVVPILVAGLIRAGARPAEPGEFTFRALASGRLDLAQAEGVAAVVSASGEAALRAAGDLLAGHLSRDIGGLIERLREVLALVEADLDFSDQDITLAPPREIAGRLAAIRNDLASLGRRSRGIETFGGEVRLVLAGWPNVGKSSLFNRLLAADRAIVTPVPGTTRDELRAALHAGGMTFVLSDVAGLDKANAELAAWHDQAPLRGHERAGAVGNMAAQQSVAVPPGESHGSAQQVGDGPCFLDELAGKSRAKALEAIGRADLVILALDSSAPAYERTDELLALVAAPMIVAITKCDLAPPNRARAYLERRGIEAEVIATSAVTGEGVEALRGALVRAVEGGAVNREAVGPVVTARHRGAMEQAAVSLVRAARQARRRRAAGELVAVELREALDALGMIAGRQADADILGEIFARFCIGK